VAVPNLANKDGFTLCFERNAILGNVVNPAAQPLRFGRLPVAVDGMERMYKLYAKVKVDNADHAGARMLTVWC
jgi:hypothetical protein